MVVAPHERRPTRPRSWACARTLAPDHQRLVEVPRCRRSWMRAAAALIGLAAELGQSRRDVVTAPAVVIPAPVVELDEPHAALHQPPREEAVVRERGLPGRVPYISWIVRGSFAISRARARSSASGRPSRRRRCAPRSPDRRRRRKCRSLRLFTDVERRRRRTAGRVPAGSRRTGRGPLRAELHALVGVGRKPLPQHRVAGSGIRLTWRGAPRIPADRRSRSRARTVSHEPMLGRPTRMPGVHEDLRRRVVEVVGVDATGG